MAASTAGGLSGPKREAPQVNVPAGCVLITGGLGFIGSYVAEAVFKTYPQSRIVVVDRCNYAASIRNARPISASPRFSLECFDLADEAATRECVRRHRPSLIFHLAAETHVDRSFGNALDFTRGNVLGTHALLEAARVCWADAASGSGSAPGVFVHMSTDEVYGSGAEASATGHAPHTSILAPTNPYAASKAAAEMQCLAYHRSFGMDVRIVRCNNVYGPRQFCEKVVPRFVLQCLAGRPLTVHGDGSQQRSFLHAEDAAAALLVVARSASAGEIVNVGHPEEIPILELAGRIRTAVGSVSRSASFSRGSEALATVFSPDRLFNDYRYPVDVARITELGWAPSVELMAGLRATAAWYRDNAAEWFSPADLSAAVDSDGHFAEASEPEASRSGSCLAKRQGGGGGAGAEGGSPPRVLLYGATGWIGLKVAALLEVEAGLGAAVLLRGAARLEDTAALWRELVDLAPSHVVCAAGITGRPNIDWCESHPGATVAVNLEGTATLALFCARLGIHMTNFATGCIYAGDASRAFCEADEPNFTGSLYSRTKVHAEKLQRGAAGATTLLLRLRMPIDADFGNGRNLVNKLCRYARLVDLPNSVSFLPEVLPVALHMALRGETGVFNLTNPGWTTPADIREAVDAARAAQASAPASGCFEGLPPPRPFERESDAASLVSSGVITAQRSNCVLDASKLAAYASAHGLRLRPAREAVASLFCP
jgi:UDP-glucose 4,6-dehydratase